MKKNKVLRHKDTTKALDNAIIETDLRYYKDKHGWHGKDQFVEYLKKNRK